MSKLNGDRARFQRLRKAGLLRRDRARAAYAAMKHQPTANLIGEPADGLPLVASRRSAMVPTSGSSTSATTEGPVLH